MEASSSAVRALTSPGERALGAPVRRAPHAATLPRKCAVRADRRSQATAGGGAGGGGRGDRGGSAALAGGRPGGGGPTPTGGMGCSCLTVVNGGQGVDTDAAIVVGGSGRVPARPDRDRRRWGGRRCPWRGRHSGRSTRGWVLVRGAVAGVPLGRVGGTAGVRGTGEDERAVLLRGSSSGPRWGGMAGGGLAHDCNQWARRCCGERGEGGGSSVRGRRTFRGSDSAGRAEIGRGRGVDDFFIVHAATQAERVIVVPCCRAARCGRGGH